MEQAGICYMLGDIFEASVQVIVNPVNVAGIMGAGLAREFRQRLCETDYYPTYEQECASGRLRVGRPTLYTRVNPWVLNFPTKQEPGDHSSLEVIKAGLGYFAAHYSQVGIQSIAFPRLGCGLGHLRWSQVGPLMGNYLEPLTTKGLSVLIYIGESDTQYRSQPLARGPYAPPAHLCSVCQDTVWQWNGYSYVCASPSGRAKHAAYQQIALQTRARSREYERRRRGV